MEIFSAVSDCRGWARFEIRPRGAAERAERLVLDLTFSRWRTSPEPGCWPTRGDSRGMGGACLRREGRARNLPPLFAPADSGWRRLPAAPRPLLAARRLVGGHGFHGGNQQRSRLVRIQTTLRQRLFQGVGGGGLRFGGLITQSPGAGRDGSGRGLGSGRVPFGAF